MYVDKFVIIYIKFLLAKKVLWTTIIQGAFFNYIDMISWVGSQSKSVNFLSTLIRYVVKKSQNIVNVGLNHGILYIRSPWLTSY